MCEALRVQDLKDLQWRRPPFRLGRASSDKSYRFDLFDLIPLFGAIQGPGEAYNSVDLHFCRI